MLPDLVPTARVTPFYFVIGATKILQTLNDLALWSRTNGLIRSLATGL